MSASRYVWFNRKDGYLRPDQVMSNSSNQMTDMTKLSDLHEGALLWNLQKRYVKSLVYTYTGNILVAVNPYQVFNIYDLDTVRRYAGQVIGSLSPHIFAIANEAVQCMLKNAADQCVVISGESGAGKTESTKLIMKYIAAINKEQSMVSEQILESNPIMESFGNAKTVRNNNSSRFGKYLEIQFSNSGGIQGAMMYEYLLEKSRVVHQATDERNYHIFYEMLAGMEPDELAKLKLGDAKQYYYLNQGGNTKVDNKDDAEEYFLCTRAMEVMGFTAEEVESVFKVLAAVLHLGNMTFEKTSVGGMDASTVKNPDVTRFAASLISVKPDGLVHSSTHRTNVTRGEAITSPLSADASADKRDALSKALYSRLFSWLVKRINTVICRNSKYHSIGILDIFGFEDFEVNSFEQLCINYANEKLQFYFNQHIFKLEQEEYSREGISWEKINFVDNQGCLDLIAKKPTGILSVLDDESNFPKGTDDSFLDKLHGQHEKNAYYEKPKKKSPYFGVRHYAGTVTYLVTGFIDRNKDTLHQDLIELICSSTDPLVIKLFESYKEQLEGDKSGNKAKRLPSVGGQFHESLSQLISTMSACNPFFVRCVKPNTKKKPTIFENTLVLTQLRYSGMLETIRIRRSGYPVRLPFAHFIFRYRVLSKNPLPPGNQLAGKEVEVAKAIMAGVAASSLGEDSYQVGKTKMFMRENVERELEKQRSERLRGIVVRIQKTYRMFQCKKRFKRILAVVRDVQRASRGYLQRVETAKKRRALVLIQAFFRMIKPRKEYIVMRDEARIRAREERLKAGILQARAIGDASTVPIPAELQAILDGVTAFTPVYSEEQALATIESELMPLGGHTEAALPDDIHSFNFSKFAKAYFEGERSWSFSKGPIDKPFLSLHSPELAGEAIGIFNCILKFMGDPSVAGQLEFILGNYIVAKGIQRHELRDEIYCQLANQTWLNPNEVNCERGWLLMSLCLGCFPPSEQLYQYLLCYVSRQGVAMYKQYCQYKLLRSFVNDARTAPPGIAEWKAARQCAPLAIEVDLPDGTTQVIAVDSSTTAEEIGMLILQAKGIAHSAETAGWTVEISSTGNVFDAQEVYADYHVLDAYSQTEMPEDLVVLAGSASAAFAAAPVGGPRAAAPAAPRPPAAAAAAAPPPPPPAGIPPPPPPAAAAAGPPPPPPAAPKAPGPPPPPPPASAGPPPPPPAAAGPPPPPPPAAAGPPPPPPAAPKAP
ncbi:hypothetical protein CAOG_08449, partial [Capsaspora owczarzaki ATCC 30864]|uniref:hypothetical protein n=1 Tax=Capsaspora owczarzaki (strain ATCC 30864) TaxID=595528 RepID=UPI0003523E65